MDRQTNIMPEGGGLCNGSEPFTAETPGNQLLNGSSTHP
jgi:hypothetical protein